MPHSHRSHGNSSSHHERIRGGKPTPTVMVTGSSGFIGQKVIRLFSNQGTSTIATYYHRLPEALPQVFPVCTDMASPELLLAPLRNVTTVVHLAWDGGLASSLTEAQMNGEVRDLLRPERMSRNLAMMANLLAAMERVGNQRIVFVSAMGASRHAESPFLREKYAAELMLLNSRVREKVILRPTILAEPENPNDRFVRAILRTMKLPLLYPVPRVANQLRPMHVDDFARKIVLATEAHREEPSLVGEVCGGEMLPVEEVFRLLADKFFAGQKIAIKGWLGNLLTALFERVRKNEMQYRNHRLRQFLALAQLPSDSLMDALSDGSSAAAGRYISFTESVQVAAPPAPASS
ncbi:MAG: hypothetical protein RIQ81_453 [Pseudomonadota bacterium]|jgi:nucleoside-diphosphate-sugar epimerase